MESSLFFYALADVVLTYFDLDDDEYMGEKKRFVFDPVTVQ